MTYPWSITRWQTWHKPKSTLEFQEVTKVKIFSKAKSHQNDWIWNSHLKLSIQIGPFTSHSCKDWMARCARLQAMSGLKSIQLRLGLLWDFESGQICIEKFDFKVLSASTIFGCLLFCFVLFCRWRTKEQVLPSVCFIMEPLGIPQ